MNRNMATIISAVGQKGGGGKSTACISLAVEYARRGARVLIGDADPQGTCLTWAAVAAEADIEIPTVVGLHEGFHRPGQLPLEAYDIAILDTPARLAKVSRAALVLADIAVVPVSAGGIESWALSETLEVVQEAEIIRPDLKAFLLVNRQQKTGIAKATMKTLADSGMPMFGTCFGFRVAFQESITAGRGPTTWEPHGKAAAEVQSLADEITEILSHVQQAANA